MQHSELLRQFASDIQIAGCDVQVGTAQKVFDNLTSRNLEECLELLEGKDVYFLAGVRSGLTARAKDEDVIRKTSFFVDFDIRKFWLQKHGENISDADLKECATGITHALANDKLLRTWRYLVFTGNGLHLHYFGDPTPLRSTQSWKEGLTRFLKKMEECVEYPPDYGCVNAGRICRLPGSKNHKNNRQIPVEIIDYQQDSHFDISAVEKVGERAKSTQGAAKSVPANGIQEGSRNNTLASLAGSLRHRGLPAGTILETLRVVNSRECKPPLPDSEVVSIAQSISKYPDEKSAQKAVCSPVVVRMEDVLTEAVQWLWHGRIPRGKLTIAEGDPGAGKSWWSMAVATAVTLGKSLPGDEFEDERKPANVLLLTAEDGLGDTIRPRLESMGADLSRVKVLTGVRDLEGKERHFSLTEDLAAVEATLKDGAYALVIIDPLNAYLGAEIDTHKDAALRSVLTPITKMAETHNVAIVCIRHLTKSPREKAMYRGQGSIAYTAAARVVHIIGAHPNNPSERVMACTKNNLAPFPLAVVYKIESGKFSWEGEKDISPEFLLAPAQSGEEKTALDEAKDFLNGALSKGHRPASDVVDEAKEASISEKTLKRAKLAIGIITRKEGFGSEGKWVWELPARPKQATEIKKAPMASLGDPQKRLDLPETAI